MISGANLTSPRTSILVTRDLLVHNEWKYVRGGSNMIEAAWGGVHYPNASTATDPIDAHSFHCPPRGCLFNLVNDLEERHEVGAEHPQIVQELAAKMDNLAATIWSTEHKNDPKCMEAANTRYGGFYGPWLEV